MPETEIALPIPEQFLQALAERVADIVIERISESLLPSSNRWMRTQEAAEYVGLTRSALHSRVADIPHHKIDRLLLFKRDDLDEWLEQHRHEPSAGSFPQVSAAPARRTRRRRAAPAPDLLPIGPKPKGSHSTPEAAAAATSTAEWHRGTQGEVGMGA